MIGCEFSDLILEPFPFTDQSTSKKRPAVVISGARYRREHPDYIIMAVTSRTRSAPALGEIIVRDWQKAGLLKPSMIKPVIATIEHDLVLKRLGSLGAEDQAVLKGAISDILG